MTSDVTTSGDAGDADDTDADPSAWREYGHPLVEPSR